MNSTSCSVRRKNEADRRHALFASVQKRRINKRIFSRVEIGVQNTPNFLLAAAVTDNNLFLQPHDLLPSCPRFPRTPAQG
jgi:hypothetical protein